MTTGYKRERRRLPRKRCRQMTCTRSDIGEQGWNGSVVTFPGSRSGGYCKGNSQEKQGIKWGRVQA